MQRPDANTARMLGIAEPARDFWQEKRNLRLVWKRLSYHGFVIRIRVVARTGNAPACRQAMLDSRSDGGLRAVRLDTRSVAGIVRAWDRLDEDEAKPAGRMTTHDEALVPRVHHASAMIRDQTKFRVNSGDIHLAAECETLGAEALRV
ncbi:hypothetical protein JHW43_003876 [Diplocarpon mali]|nr:hypothetical protein JHW43_003876 [Diplocarpon mali]